MIVYLHGFRSSPSSFKARLIAERLRAQGMEKVYHAPALPVCPEAALRAVEALGPLGPADTLIGSSLGGCLATALAERHGCRAVLLNPAVQPAARMARYLGPQTMFHDPSLRFDWTQAHLDALARIEVAVTTRPERYFLIAATGDEVLDWREMVAFYSGATQKIIQGSDHGLSDFEDSVDAVLTFAGLGTPRS